MKVSMTPGIAIVVVCNPEERSVTMQKVMADTGLAQLL